MDILFPKVCTDPIRYRYNKIISFNERYLQEHDKYNESIFNLKVNQDIA